MITAFRQRRTVPAFIVLLIFGPMIGMFYLGRGRLGLTYLALDIIALAALIFLPQALLAGMKITAAWGVLGLVLRLIGLIHATLIAKRNSIGVPNSWFARWYMLLLFLILPIAVAISLKSFVLQAFNIPAASMLPTLRVGDHIFVSKFSYGYSRYSLPGSLPLIDGRILATPPKRGDIAVFRLPSDPRTDYIKRVIGLPGDEVQLREGRPYLNGQIIPRKQRETITVRNQFGRPTQVPVFIETLPNGRAYPIIEFSDDGPLDNTGTYTVPPGHYFMMGDNRDNSQDSRVLHEVGYIPAENFVGKAWFRFWNSSHRIPRFEPLQ